ncbi:hypothetical protein [Bradyrhizobium sp. RT5a]|uniref:hypothetical protein n=1 Tax=unclassified Bradyrhizobium TaxID=2631580 RepID=UPI0033996455
MAKKVKKTATKKKPVRREYTKADVKELRSFESEDSGCKNCEAHKALRRLTPPKGAQAWNPARSPALEGGIMTLFNRVFSTRTLLQIICVLVAVVAMKLLDAHYDFSWAAAVD